MASQAAPLPIKIPLKRVIRQDELYFCGVCWHGHQSHQGALHCLDRCAQRLMFKDMLDRVRVMGKGRFRCGFCFHTYHNQEEAESCISTCRQSWRDLLGQSHSICVQGRPRVRRTYKPQGKPVQMVVLPPYRAGPLDASMGRKQADHLQDSQEQSQEISSKLFEESE